MQTRQRWALLFSAILLLPGALRAQEKKRAEARVRLGKLLFFDKRLSSDKTVSCATCHDPKKGWSDHKPISIGVFHRLGERNAPTVLNAFRRKTQFWDGRVATLEEQAKDPIRNPKEMDLAGDSIVDVVKAIKGYRPLFRAAYGDDSIDMERVVHSMGDFQRTLSSGGSPYDRFLAGQRGALSKPARRGLALFNGKAGCASCHSGPDLTDEGFHNVGVGMQRRVQDLGRHRASKDEADKGAFRTPMLRNLSDTPPYMHDGSLATLEEVIDYFDRGGYANPWLSPRVKALGLSAEEKKDLLSFLRALDGDKRLISPPASFPR